MKKSKFLRSCMGFAVAVPMMVSATASADHLAISAPSPEDMGLPPGTPVCEVNPFAFGDPGQPFILPADDSVTIELGPSEREVLALAVPGYIAAVQAESVGTGPSGFAPPHIPGPFPDRAGGLDWFANVTVPCIYDQVTHDETGLVGLGPEESVTVTFNSFERVAVQIMAAIWNDRDGVMSHHTAGCTRSHELQTTPSGNLCQTFFPLAEAVESLFKKVTKDQQ